MIFSTKKEITKFKGTPVELSGTELKVGDVAPIVNTVTTDLADKQIGGGSKKAQLVIVVPSLDTPTCDTETRKFNQKIAEFANLDAVIVSMDLPFAGRRFCSIADIENLSVTSDFRNREFAKAYGVLIASGPLAGLTCRAIFVISKDGRITYRQLVPEITQEPDYNEALEAAKKAATTGAGCCGVCQ